MGNATIMIYMVLHEGYVTAAALNYTFHFYRMHEHVSASHRKDSFNK